MYKLIWADEFDYEGPPNPDKWGYTTGGHGFGNNEIQYYTSRTDPAEANAYVTGGRLVITLRKEDMENRHYTSARISTVGKASWTYGRFDISAKLPRGLGTWPAIWMLADSIGKVRWPECGEIDIMEHVGKMQDIIHFSLHSKTYNHKIGTHITHTDKYPGVSDGFHLYSVIWEENEIEFLVDGVSAIKWTNGQDGRETDNAAWPFTSPFFLILNLAYGGGFGGTNDDSCLPQTMEVEYVRVYQKQE